MIIYQYGLQPPLPRPSPFLYLYTNVFSFFLSWFYILHSYLKFITYFPLLHYQMISLFLKKDSLPFLSLLSLGLF